MGQVTLAWWLAALPIAVILVAMIVFRKSAAFAGLVGLALTMVLALGLFGFAELAEVDGGLWRGLTGSLVEAGFTALTILWIIFGALCLHQLQTRTGAIEVLRQGVGTLSADPRIIAILIAWFFALFVEGAAGFGTSVALAAPFLVGFGFHPVQAVTIALVGHSVGVSFGAVGTPIMPQAAVTAWTAPEIARVTGAYHALAGWIMLAVVLAVVTRTARREQRELVPVAGWFLLGAVGFLLPMWAISRWIGPELPTMGGAVVGGAVFVTGLRIFHSGSRAKPVEQAEEGAPTRRTGVDSLCRAAAPYAVVILLILATRLIGPVQAALQGISLEWELFGSFSGSFQPLYHPGTMLMAGFLVGGLIQRATRAQFYAAARGGLHMLGLVTVALFAMLAISRLMVHAGMIDALAAAAASAAGSAWPLIVPAVGVLGTFVTGSATASNILFTDFQWATAQRLELDGLRLIGAQGFGAAVGNIISPHNIIAGCATVGIAGQEGAILRQTLGACAIYAVVGGLLAYFFVS